MNLQDLRQLADDRQLGLFSFDRTEDTDDAEDEYDYKDREREQTCPGA